LHTSTGLRGKSRCFQSVTGGSFGKPIATTYTDWGVYPYEEETPVKTSRAFWVLVVVLLLAPLAHADGTPVTMVLTGVNGANDGQFYVSPYYGTMNSAPVTLFCDDIKNDASLNKPWYANVTNMASGNLSNTRYGDASIALNPSVLADARVLYEEAAWLTTQFASHPTDYVSLQYAIWDLLNPGSELTSYGDVQTWLDRAAHNYNDGSINYGDFSIVTNVGPLSMTGQVQEYIVRTPEPGTLALLLCGLTAFALLSARRRQVAAV